ncbi:MAG: LysR family transcriptional regulator [Pseudoruegeria sp.]
MSLNKLPSLAALRAFEAAARHQSFSKAAQELNVTHAAIAQHVRSLEGEFSETLIQRQGHSMIPTSAGRELAEDLKAGFSRISDGVDKIRTSGDNRPLNISVTPGFAANWLMPRIGEFWANYPEITLNINPTIGLVDLKRDGFDLAIRYGEGNWPRLHSEMLSNGDFWVVAHRDLLEGRRVNCLDDVLDLPWFLENHTNERRVIVEREGVDFDKINLTLFNTTELVLSAVLSKLGVSLQERSLVDQHIKNGELVNVCALSQPGLGYYLVTLPERNPPGLRQLTKWLRSKAQEAT